ncbi:MAG: DUF6444 domain-containing protein, partial [Mycobacteriales bacterium]
MAASSGERGELARLRSEHAQLSRAFQHLVGQLKAMGQTNAELAQTNAELAETNARLLARVAELERRLSRNSGNSSLPPSGDDQPGRARAKRAKQAGSTRRRGKQPGAAGAGPPWREDPDERVDHFPSGACECGASLAEATDLGVAASHQVHEMPLVTAAVTQHDLHL